MSILAIDTATRSRVVVVLADLGGEVLAGGGIEGAAVPSLARAMRDLPLEDLSAVVCVTGPGTYTGLRAGLAAATGIAHAAGVPLHGVGSLEVAVAAATGAESIVATMLDAGRGAAYVAEFSRIDGPWQQVGEIQRLPWMDVPEPGVRVDALSLEAHAAALAAAVPAALLSPSLPLTGIGASYAETSPGTGAEAPVSSR